MALRIRVIKSLSGLNEIGPVWSELEQIGDKPRVYQSLNWNLTWLKLAAQSGSSIEPSIRVVEDESGQILAILPFCESRLAGLFLKTVKFIGGANSNNNDILLSEPDNTGLVDQVIYLMLRSIGPRSILHLKHLVDESLFTRRLVANQVAPPMCTHLRLLKNSEVSGQFAYLSKSGGKRLRYKQNKLGRDHGVEFRVKSGADLSGALETILDLHNKRFESKGKSTSLVGFDLKFLRSMIDQIPEKFDLVELHASGRPIASRLMLIDGRTCFGILTGFEPEFASYSPMRILLNESIRRSFEELNCQYYDMGPGYEAYKLEWDPSAAWNRFCCIGGFGPYAKIAGMAFRAVWSRSLPRSYGTVG